MSSEIDDVADELSDIRSAIGEISAAIEAKSSPIAELARIASALEYLGECSTRIADALESIDSGLDRAGNILTKLPTKTPPTESASTPILPDRGNDAT